MQRLVLDKFLQILEDGRLPPRGWLAEYARCHSSRLSSAFNCAHGNAHGGTLPALHPLVGQRERSS